MCRTSIGQDELSLCESVLKCQNKNGCPFKTQLNSQSMAIHFSRAATCNADARQLFGSFRRGCLSQQTALHFPNIEQLCHQKRAMPLTQTDPMNSQLLVGWTHWYLLAHRLSWLVDNPLAASSAGRSVARRVPLVISPT